MTGGSPVILQRHSPCFPMNSSVAFPSPPDILHNKGINKVAQVEMCILAHFSLSACAVTVSAPVTEATLWGCIGVPACGIPDEHPPTSSRYDEAPVRSFPFRPIGASWLKSVICGWHHLVLCGGNVSPYPGGSSMNALLWSTKKGAKTEARGIPDSLIV